MSDKRSDKKGRGSFLQPPNRFGGPHYVPDLEQVEHDADYLAQLDHPETEYLPDQSRSIVTENQSPDVSFRFSLNPYRGCLHGCSYCYARPTHEYLGLNAGLDFETKIFVKHQAAELFRDFLAKPGWKAEPIGLSGVTDPYQPIERQMNLTRNCLAIAKDAFQPMMIITKNALVLRDLDILGEMARANLVHVNITLTTLDADLARIMEPRTSTPEARVRAIRELSQAGVPVRVMMAPILPGLTDSEIPAVLQAAREAGAQSAAFTLVRLPLTVAPVFLDWLERNLPEKRKRVEERIREIRGGKLNDPNFGSRMTGSGEIAEQIAQMFRVFRKKCGLDGRLSELDGSAFRPPGQIWLF